MQVAAWSHGNIARLERKPLSAPDCDSRIVDGVGENAARQGNFSRCQKALAPCRATDRWRGGMAFDPQRVAAIGQRASPAA